MDSSDDIFKGKDDSRIYALKAIAEMQVTETSNFRELLALCISIAKNEIEK